MSENDDNLQKTSRRRSWLRVVGMAMAVFVPLAAIIIIADRIPMKQRNRGSMCGRNLSYLGKSMLVYSNDYDGQLPTGESWCDLLVMYVDVEADYFRCKKSGDVVGQSSYALNRNLLGKSFDELDDEMVLAFETNLGKGSPLVPVESRAYYKDFPSSKSPPMVAGLRWNQVGGPEIAAGDNHGGTYYILFVDMHVEYVRSKGLAYLDWGEPNSPGQ